MKKRRGIKPVGVGSICRINPETLNRMVSEESYLNNSVSYIKEIEDGHIVRSDISKKNPGNNRVLIEDAGLVYVAKDSIFGGGIVEIVPVTIKRDRWLVGLRSLYKVKKKFYMPKKSLILASRSEIESVEDAYSYNIRSFVSDRLTTDYGYNFSW
jgi:hypothetical protein